MKSKFSEKEVKQAVTAYLTIKQLLFVPIQNQGQWDRNKKIYRRFTGTRGAPDLMVLAKNGEWICVELKSSVGKQSKAQVEFQRLTEANGGVYIVVRSIDDLVDAKL